MSATPSTLQLPDLALVVLVGAAGCGKSTVAARHFAAGEVVSSDACRALVAGDEADQSATAAAFEVLHLIVAKRLERGLLTVVDATSVQRDARRPLVALARRHHVPAVALVLDLPLERCLARNAARGAAAGRVVDDAVIRRQWERLQQALPTLAREGFAAVHRLDDADALESLAVARVPLPEDHRADPGPFDVVGDVHGCADELHTLLRALGWAPDDGGAWRHPEGRRLVFVGDLVDRGPDARAVLRTVMASVAAGTALAVPGNHDEKLARALRGRPVAVAHGLAASLAQLADAPAAERAAVARFVESLPSHLVLDGGRLVVAHAGLPAALHGRHSPRVRELAVHGPRAGRADPHGLSERVDWAARYAGEAAVVYGHAPAARAEWRHHTMNVDTGCVFGGALTALRWPERTTVSVPARARYAVADRAFVSDPAPAPTDLAEPAGA